MNYNKVILLGNLTRDPEVKHTPKGTAIARIGLAVNRRYTTEGGDAKEEVTFVDIDAWGKQAEVIGKYCRKGQALMIDGRLKFDQWDDKTTGKKQSKLSVVLETFQFIGGKRDDEQPPPAARPTQATAPKANDPLDGPPPEEDDVPF